MAQKKGKSKGGQRPPLSPKKYIKEKGRTLPLGKCYITSDWKEQGVSQIIVTRVRPAGNLAIAIFLTDTFCLGVKDIMLNHNLPPYEFEELLESMQQSIGIEEITYNEAHNIIFGAIEWAEEGGIAPHKDFAIAQYLLEEDNDDVPLIEYEFGRNGKHFLVVTSRPEEKRYIATLRKNLGENFDYSIIGNPYSDDYDDYYYYDDEDFEEDDDDEEDFDEDESSGDSEEDEA